MAARLVADSPDLLAGSGALHLLAKRSDVRAVRWLLDHGADPNARWMHWDAEVTPLHMAAWSGSTKIVRALLAAGADPSLHDSKHDGDALDWAEHFGRPELRTLLMTHAATSLTSRGQREPARQPVPPSTG